MYPRFETNLHGMACHVMACLAPHYERCITHIGVNCIHCQVIAGLSQEEASSAEFEISLRIAVADITGALPSDVVVTSIEFTTSSVTGEMTMTVKYTVTSSEGVDGSTMESSLLDSVTSGLMTEILVTDGYVGVDASEVPEIVLILETPTSSPSPSFAPTFAKPLTVAPSVAPSIRATVIRTPRPSRRQPTGIPSSSLLANGKYRIIFFYGQMYLDGVKYTAFNNTIAQTDLRSAIAKSMTGVRLRDVGFMNAIKTDTFAPPAQSRMLYSSKDPGDLQGVSNGIAVNFQQISADSTTATYSVSVPMTAPYVDDAEGLYASLDTQIHGAINGGSTLATLQLSGVLGSVVNVSTALGPYTVFVVTAPTSAPTSPPTSHVVIPTVRDIHVQNTTRTTVAIDVTLVKDSVVVGDSSDGVLYCTALANGTAPTSTGSFKGVLMDDSFKRFESVALLPESTYPQTQRLTFTGLDALRTYAVYCYVETSVGVGNNLAAVLATKTLAKTTCCKRIEIVGSPAFVYGDVKKYKQSDTSLYTFNYILSDVPSISVKVVPAVYINGLVSTVVTATQSNTASLLGGQFILTAPATFSGLCELSFVITGRSASEYTTEMYSVEILSSLSKIPAPDMVSCRFSDSGQSAVVQFRSPTDSAGFAAGTWPCSSLFSFINADKSTCSWIDSEAVSMTFGVVGVIDNYQYLIPGNTVTLLPNLLRAFCTRSRSFCSVNPTTNKQTTTVLEPLNPASPTVILSAPSYISSCSNLSLDATASYGDGGRLYSAVKWSVTAMELGVTDIPLDVTDTEIYMNTFSAEHQARRPLILAGDTLILAAYTITLTLTNFLGLTSSKTVVVVASSDPSLPILAVLGPSYRSIMSSDPLQIMSSVSLTSCVPKDTAVKYKWSVTMNGEAVVVDNRSKNPSKFSIRPYSLEVDGEYSVTVTASAGSSSVSATALVYVAHGPIKAVIVGGTTRCVPIDKVLVLDASYTTDSDISSSATSHLAFEVTSFILYSYSVVAVTTKR